LTKDQRKVFDDSVKDDDDEGREQTLPKPTSKTCADATCPTCQGTRLNATARAVQFGALHASIEAAGVAVSPHCSLAVTDVRKWVQTLQVIGGMTTREGDIARDLVPEIKSRLEFLEEVGLGYLTLDRGAPTLSVAARHSESAWRPSWVATCKACAMCWTSPPLACTRGTTRFCWVPCSHLSDKGKHAGGGGARRGHHPPCGPHHRHRAERG